MNPIVETPLPRLVTRQVVPTFFGFGSGHVTALVEMILISRLGGDAIPIVGVVGLAMMIPAFFNEIPGGSSIILLAREIGSGQMDKAREVARQTYFLKFSLGVMSAFLVGLIAWPLLLSLGATPAMRSSGLKYMQLLLLALPFSFSNWTSFSVLRGLGRAREAMRLQIGLNAVTVGLQLVLIPHWGLNLGLIGAGLAALSGHLLTFVCGVTYLSSRRWSPLALEFRGNLRFTKMAPEIVALGAPIAIASFANQGFALIAGRLINSVSMPLFAAMQVFGRVSGILEMVTTAFNINAVPVMGQNIGAGRRDRAVQYLRISSRVGGGVLLLAAVAMALFPVPLLRMFTFADVPTYEMTLLTMRILALAPLTNFVVALATSWCHAHRDTRSPLWVGLGLRWGLHMPLLALLVGVWRLGETSILGLGLAMGFVLAGGMVVRAARHR